MPRNQSRIAIVGSCITRDLWPIHGGGAEDLLYVSRTGLATHSAELQRSGYLSRPAFRRARTVPRLSAACERLWLEGASEFAALVRATPLGRASLILHSARWAHDQRLPDGRVAPIRDVE